MTLRHKIWVIRSTFSVRCFASNLITCSFPDSRRIGHITLPALLGDEPKELIKGVAEGETKQEDKFMAGGMHGKNMAVAARGWHA
mgnify:CR=1 FL=1